MILVGLMVCLSSSISRLAAGGSKAGKAIISIGISRLVMISI